MVRVIFPRRKPVGGSSGPLGDTGGRSSIGGMILPGLFGAFPLARWSLENEG